MEYLLKTEITCGKCITGPGEYQLNEGDTFEVAAQFKDFPRVTESIRLKPGRISFGITALAILRRREAPERSAGPTFPSAKLLGPESSESPCSSVKAF